jgi:hypothetical protein
LPGQVAWEFSVRNEGLMIHRSAGNNYACKLILCGGIHRIHVANPGDSTREAESFEGRIRRRSRGFLYVPQSTCAEKGPSRHGEFFWKRRRINDDLQQSRRRAGVTASQQVGVTSANDQSPNEKAAAINPYIIAAFDRVAGMILPCLCDQGVRVFVQCER